jgi:hypothetical protein
MNMAFDPQKMIFLPFEKRELPPHEDYTKRSLEWMAEFALDSNMKKLGEAAAIGSALTGAFFTRTRTGDPLQDNTDLYAWAFYFDDLCDNLKFGKDLHELTALINILTVIFDNPRCNFLDDMPLARALRDLSFRFERWVPSHLLGMLRESFRAWVLSYSWDRAIIDSGGAPDIGTHLALRLPNSGAHLVFATLEVFHEMRLTAEERGLPYLRAAFESSALIASIDNDIYGHAKTRNGGEAIVDLLDFLMKHNPSWGEADSIAYATYLRDAFLTYYLRLKDRYWRNSSDEVRSYFRICEDTITGNVVMGAAALRYVAPGNPYADREWVSHPVASSVTLPDISYIAWWKELLPM